MNDVEEIQQAKRFAANSRDPDEISKQIMASASKSRLTVAHEEEEPEKEQNPNPLTVKELEAMVGKVCVRIHPGIFVGAKYTVKELAKGDGENPSKFLVSRDTPPLDYTVECQHFAASMKPYEEPKKETPKKPEPPKGNNPWRLKK